MSRRLKQTFLQRWHTDGQEVHERCSVSLIIREMKIQATMRSTSHAKEGVEKRELSYTFGGTINWE